MANYNKITESKYKAVKLLLKSGATVKEAAEYMDISEITVYSIRNTEDYTEYLSIAAEKALQRKKQIAAMKAKEEPKAEPAEEPKGVVPVQTVKQMVVVQLSHETRMELQKTNQLLTQISNKLAFIVDELCGVKVDAKQDH